MGQNTSESSEEEDDEWGKMYDEKEEKNKEQDRNLWGGASGWGQKRERGHEPWKRYAKTFQRERCPNCAATDCGWNETGRCSWPKRPDDVPYPNKPRCHTCRETGHKANRCTNIERMRERASMDPTYRA